MSKLPLLPGLLLGLMNVLLAPISFLPKEFQARLSTFMIGGLFGIVSIPIIFLYFAFTFLDAHIFLPNNLPSSFYLIALPLFIIYQMQVLFFDRTPFKPLLVGESRYKEESRTWFQSRAKSFWIKHFDYFPMTIQPWSENAKLPIDKQYVFAVHPHGIHCWPLNVLSFISGPFDKRFPDLVGVRLTGLVASVLFYIPLVRELFLSMGYVDAARSVADKVLQCGRSLYVCTGGEEESMIMSSAEFPDAVVLSKRKGFIRLAVSHGTSLVPVFGVGVNALYSTYDLGSLPLRQKIQKSTGIALPFFHGVLGSPLPYKTPIKVLIGEPIETPVPKVKGEKPDEEVVDRIHKLYIERVKKMYFEETGVELRIV